MASPPRRRTSQSAGEDDGGIRVVTDCYRGVPPYAETRAYVLRILAGYPRVSHPFDAGITTPSPQLSLMRTMGR